MPRRVPGCSGPSTAAMSSDGIRAGIEELVVRVVERGEKRFDLASERGVAAAAFVQDRVAIARVEVGEREKDLFGAVGRVTAVTPPEANQGPERPIQPRARERPLVLDRRRREVERAAVSSTLSPAKYRSDTICALRGSVCSRRVSASSTATRSVSAGSARMIALSSSTRSSARRA